MRNENEANRAWLLYADMIRRLCTVQLKNYADVEDVFQDVFLKYILRDGPFISDAHEKAWFIRVAINACKDVQKSAFFRRTIPLEELCGEQTAPEDERELIAAVRALNPKYRSVIYLHYYEGYSAVEIAKILKKKENTIYTWLARARQLLSKRLGGEQDGKETAKRT